MKPSFTRALCRRRVTWFAWLSLWAACASAQDTPLVLMIQPTLGVEATRQAFQPLVDYLEKATGSRFTIVTQPNFLGHWQTVRRNSGYDLGLDDPHLTDYRVRKIGIHVLAKVPGTTSYSLIVPNTKKRVFDPLELTGKKVASFGPPSIGATRLSAMFLNPSRRPTIVEIDSASEGMALLLQGKVNAAMLPTSLIAEQVGRGEAIVVMSTEPTPHMALSISPRINTALREKVRAALLRAGKPGDGAQALRHTGFESLEPATAATYANQSRILKDYWGY